MVWYRFGIAIAAILGCLIFASIVLWWIQEIYWLSQQPALEFRFVVDQCYKECDKEGMKYYFVNQNKVCVCKYKRGTL